jgi:hypothetical protein
VLATALIAVALAVAAATWWFSSVASGPLPAADPNVDGRRLAAIYDPPSRAVEAAINKGDGQLFAALATDPAVLRPSQVRGPEAEQAYRYQRMGYGWLGWLASGGQAAAVPWALIAVTVASIGLLVGAGGLLLLDRGIDPRFALLLALQPAVFIDLTWIGPEVLGTALALIGLVSWTRRSAPVAAAGTAAAATPQAITVAVACFAAAGLCRETLLLVPAVLAVRELVAKRWAAAWMASAAATPYVAWVLLLRVRIGAWPSGSVDGRLSVVPFRGLVQAASGWGAADAAVAALVLVPAILAVVAGERGPLRAVVVAHVALAATLGQPVWNRWPDFSRVLLPLSTVAIVLVVDAAVRARRGARSPASSGNLGTWSNVPPPAPSPTLPAPTSSRTSTAG